MSILLPDGIDHLGDCPFPLHSAITTALRILHYEEFPPDERPPKRIWLDAEKLEQWWKDIDRKRNGKYGLSTSDGDGEVKENAVELIARG